MIQEEIKKEKKIETEKELSITKTSDKGNMQKYIYYGILLLIFVLPAPQFFNPCRTETVLLQAKILALFALYFFIMIILDIVINRVSFHIKNIPLAWWCIAAMILAGLISLTQADYLYVSFFGGELRGEGFLQICCYYMSFLAASLLKEKKYRKRILLCYIVFSVVVAVIGLLQFLKIYSARPDLPGLASVPMGNPNLFAAYSILFTGICMAGFLYYQKENEYTHPFSFWTRPIWYILVLLGYIACFSARSSVIYVGIIMIFLMMLFVEIVGKTYRFSHIVSLLLGFLAVLFLLNFLSDGRIVKEFLSTGKEIAEEGTIFGDSVGTNRMKIYRESLGMLPDYWLFGGGIEQYFVMYMRKYGIWDMEHGYIIDNAHNEYLNLWLTEGIIAILAYLVLLFALFIPSLIRIIKTAHKKDADVFRNMLFIGFFGYIAQAFFNIRAIQSAPYFWMFCGLLFAMKGQEEEVLPKAAEETVLPEATEEAGK